MDDRIEHSGDSAATTRSAFGRREMLQRTGFVVGAAALWTTPLVKSISASAAVPTGLGAPLCIGDDDEFNCNGDRPLSLTFAQAAWNGSLATLYAAAFPDANLGSCKPAEPKHEFGPGDPDNLATVSFFEGQLNNTTLVSGPHPVANLPLSVTADVAWMTVVFYDGLGAIIARIAFHTSCSQYLACGDRFGFVRISGGTRADGSTVSC